jgi:hypothetical protein
LKNNLSKITGMRVTISKCALETPIGGSFFCFMHGRFQAFFETSAANRFNDPADMTETANAVAVSFRGTTLFILKVGSASRSL